MRILHIIRKARIVSKKQVVLFFGLMSCQLFVLSLTATAQQGYNDQSRIRENGAEVILDGSLHATGASRTDKFFENVGVSTPTTPSSKHSRTWLNASSHQICTIFDNGSTTCLTGGGGSVGTITGVTAGLGLNGGGTTGVVTIGLSTPIANSFIDSTFWLTTSSAVATYLSSATAASTYLTQSSATATYLQLSSATATYLNQLSAATIYLTQSSATATYLQLSSATATYLSQGSAASTYLTQSSATATYLQNSSATITYLSQSSAANTYLTQSSATATYLQDSSATVTYLQNSSATVTYCHANGTGCTNIGGTGTVNPGTLGDIAYYATSTNTVSASASVIISTFSPFTVTVAGPYVLVIGTGNANSASFVGPQEIPNPYLAYTINDSGVQTDYKGYSDYNIIQAHTNSSYESYNARPYTNGSNNFNYIIGVAATPRHNSTGTINFIRGGFLSGEQSGGVAGNYQGLEIGDVTIDSGTVTTGYGLYVDQLSHSGTNWAIYTVGTTTSAFGGQVQMNGVTGNPIHGTNMNDVAAAGYVGESISSFNSSPNNFPTSTQFGDGTSIALTPGDWDLSAFIRVNFSATTTTSIQFGISKTTGNSNTGLNLGDNYGEISAPVGSATQQGSGCIAGYPVHISANTTYYLKVVAIYSGTTPTYGCRLSARRMR